MVGDSITFGLNSAFAENGPGADDVKAFVLSLVVKAVTAGALKYGKDIGFIKPLADKTADFLNDFIITFCASKTYEGGSAFVRFYKGF